MSYLDTSVLVAYYCAESISPKVQKTLRGLAEPTISPLVELEFHSALSTKVRTRELDSLMASRIAAMFQLHVSDGLFRIVAIGANEYAIARQWLAAFDSPLRTLDALHLAAAFANELPLISADQVLIRCARQLGVKNRLIS